MDSFFRFESEKKEINIWFIKEKKKHFKILEYQAFILNMEFRLENQRKSHKNINEQTSN